MVAIGTPGSATAVKVLLLGSGELGKELVIELQRLGVEVIAADRYDNAPAMQVAHRRHIINMLDAAALSELIELERPDYIIPEIEAIATDVLVDVEQQGNCVVVPCARATQLTMDREGIRCLAADELELPTSPFTFAESEQELRDAAAYIGFPCVVKPVMSSSGKGQSVLKSADDIASSWAYAVEGGRAGRTRVIVEGFVDFDYEITLLTVRTRQGTYFCTPIGHRQEGGDYVESWQPQVMSEQAVRKAEQVAGAITDALGGYGIFGVELFVKGDEVLFNEVSPRPHDTGMVTLISQDLSEFALHARAILGLPVHGIGQYGAAASAVIKSEGDSEQVMFGQLQEALAEPGTDLRLFGKPELHGTRRMGVGLALAEDTDLAREKALRVAQAVKVTL